MLRFPTSTGLNLVSSCLRVRQVPPSANLYQRGEDCPCEIPCLIDVGPVGVFQQLPPAFDHFRTHGLLFRIASGDLGLSESVCVAGVFHLRSWDLSVWLG